MFSIPVLVAAVNVQSVKIGGKMAVVCTIGKVMALGVIVIGGMVKLGQGTLHVKQTKFILKIVFGCLYVKIATYKIASYSYYFQF